jgi:hypothetical protein
MQPLQSARIRGCMVHCHVHVREPNTPSAPLISNTDPTVTCSLRRASIAIPAGLHGPILHSLKQKMTLLDAIAETRFISFVIAIGILMLFFGPHIVWKFMGQKSATELVKRWEAEDARLHAPGTFVPVWTVKLAGYVSYDTVRWSIQFSVPYLLNPRFFLASHNYNPICTPSIILSSSCVPTCGMLPSCFLLSLALMVVVDQWPRRPRFP